MTTKVTIQNLNDTKFTDSQPLQVEFDPKGTDIELSVLGFEVRISKESLIKLAEFVK